MILSSTHFGERTIALDEKQGLVDEVFHKVADRYDLMNDLMSFGVHRLWKDMLVTQINPPRGARGFCHLDLAGGTGDVALRVLGRGGTGTRSLVLDINAEMLRVGQARASTQDVSSRLGFMQGNAEALPFDDHSFDAISIAFGIRNVPRIDVALKEVHRVLKPGGHFLCLEFSRVDVPGLDRLYDSYSRHVIPRLGAWVTGDAQPYQYLVESIRHFPGPNRFCSMMRQAGLGRVRFTPLSGGIVALHSGWRI